MIRMIQLLRDAMSQDAHGVTKDARHAVAESVRYDPQRADGGPVTGRRPEADVILCSARRQVTGAAAEGLGRLLEGELDWDWITDTAERHGTANLLHRVLASGYADRVSARVLAELGRTAHLQALRNELLAQSLADLVPAFAADGVRVLAFKGPVLAVGVYGDLALRSFGDLDLLVHRRDYRRAGRLLVRLGYPRVRSLRWEAAFQRDLTAIDLHRALTSPRFPVRLPFGQLWERRQAVTIAGVAVPALSSEHLLIALCVQVAKDAWENRVRLEKVCDVAELVRGATDLNWDQLLHDAEG